jgi:hypothetical protein
VTGVTGKGGGVKRIGDMDCRVPYEFIGGDENDANEQSIPSKPGAAPMLVAWSPCDALGCSPRKLRLGANDNRRLVVGTGDRFSSLAEHLLNAT